MGAPPLRLLCYGEVLWDLIEGVPHLGGAPFNVAAHASRLGVEAWLMSAVGDDELGLRALSEIRRHGIKSELVQVLPGVPTGTVAVTLHAGGQPSYVIHEGVAWDRIAAEEGRLSKLGDLGFSMLVYGSLAQRAPASRACLDRVRKTLLDVPGFFDVNLRQNFYDRETLEASLASATFLKLNGDEVGVLSRLLFGLPVAHAEFCRLARDRYGIDLVIVTLGAQGALVADAEGVRQAPGDPVKVVDAVGAGDAFSAAFLQGQLSGMDPLSAVSRANRLGAYVAGQRGAVPEYDRRILEDLEI
ncbi:MAG: carbohydrate kinase [Spirochaetes bacterium]|nr:carbohydrate kinase [Spirochaetota bacterium]